VKGAYDVAVRIENADFRHFGARQIFLAARLTQQISGSKTDGAAKCFSVKIGGFDTIPPKMPGSRIYKSASRRDAAPP